MGSVAAVVFPYRSMFTGTAYAIHAKRLPHGIDDPGIGLVCDDQIEIGDVESVIGKDGPDRFWDEFDRLAEQLTAVHDRYVQPGIELGIVHPGLMAEAHPWDVDQLQHVAIRPEARSDVPESRIVASTQHDRACAVTEQHAPRPVPGVFVPLVGGWWLVGQAIQVIAVRPPRVVTGVDLGPDHEHGCRSPRYDEGVGQVEAVEKPGALCPEVVRRDAGASPSSSGSSGRSRGRTGRGSWWR